MINPLDRLRKELTKKKLDGLLISSHANIVYLTSYSGFSKEEREAYLFIVGYMGYILTDGRYTQAVKTLIPGFKLIEISSKLSHKEALRKLIKKHEIKRLGFEGNNITFLEHKKLFSRFNDLNHFSINSLRAIKSQEEISKIKKACELGDKAFDYVLKKIKLGISEKELAFEIEFFIKRHGADLSFPPIVAFGANSAIPHHVPTFNSQLSTFNSIVLLDFGVKLDNYCSDMTRTVFFGKPTPEQKRMYQTVLTAQTRAIDLLNSLFMIHNSIPAKNIDKIARDYIVSKGYKTIPHSVGHGIGIEVHEHPHLSPKSKDILKVGMVFSIEPGIYIPARNASASVAGGPDFGGVRIEDLAVIRNNKLTLLTNSPKQLIIL